MTTLTETTHAGEHILSEANGERSREAVTVTGGPYVAGTVMGVITASGKYTQHDEDADTGIEDAVAILYDAADGSAADVTATVTVRDSEVDDGLLTWPTGIAAGDKTDGITSLAGQGIIVRGA